MISKKKEIFHPDFFSVDVFKFFKFHILRLLSLTNLQTYLFTCCMFDILPIFTSYISQFKVGVKQLFN